MDLKNYDADDPERNLKRLNKVVGVGMRVQLQLSKKRKSLQIETKEERTEKLLVNL
jgi:hypothetical protein